jgi:hypothetical protein
MGMRPWEEPIRLVVGDLTVSVMVSTPPRPAGEHRAITTTFDAARDCSVVMRVDGPDAGKTDWDTVRVALSPLDALVLAQILLKAADFANHEAAKVED